MLFDCYDLHLRLVVWLCYVCVCGLFCGCVVLVGVCFDCLSFDSVVGFSF